MEKHKAIFKGAICENLYSLETIYRHRINFYDSSSYESIEKEETIGTFNNYLIKKVTEISRYEDIWNGLIHKPSLEVGEEIYINDLNIVVKIAKKYRTTNDEIIYETKHVISILDTENTKSTRLDIVDKWFKVSYPYYDTFEQLKSEFIKEEPIEKGQARYISPWEREENKKKEKTWFDWFSK